jgi:hypothetical protein
MDTSKGEQTNPLSDIVVRDQDACEVRIGDLWRDGPAALVWLRHYG